MNYSVRRPSDGEIIASHDHPVEACGIAFATSVASPADSFGVILNSSHDTVAMFMRGVMIPTAL